MRWSFRHASSVLSAAWLAGCGLVLDAAPPRADATVDTLDAGRGMDADPWDAGDAMAALDAGSNVAADGGLEIDAASLAIDATFLVMDATLPDATVVERDASIDARLVMSVDAYTSRDAPDADADARDAPDGDAWDARILDAWSALRADAAIDAASVCSPIDGSGCESGLTCDIRLSVMASAYCREIGPGAPGAPCAEAVDCGSHTTCLAGTCRSLCGTIGAMCAAGGVCSSFVPRVTFRSLEVGYCL